MNFTDAGSQYAKDLLDPESLARLNRLELEVRRVIEGLFAGRHKSPLLGASVEFADHKLYTPGDDIRRIDWRAFARSDRYTLKRFEAETNLSAIIVLDATGSMSFAGGKGKSKLEFAKLLVASLAYILLKQHDSVGLIIVGEETQYQAMRQGLSNLAGLLYRIAPLEAKGAGSLEEALEAVRARMKKRGYAAIVSDFLEDSPALMPRIKQMAEREQTVSIFHTLDRNEILFPYEDILRFEDIEGDFSELLNARELADEYRAAARKFIGDLRKGITASGGEYTLAVTDNGVDKLLLSYLRKVNTKRKR